MQSRRGLALFMDCAYRREELMNIAKVGALSMVATLLWAPCVDAVFGQTASRPTAITATAHIPFDFWMEDTPLPAGDYSISVDVASIVVFWNKKASIGQHAFLIPTGRSVTSKDYSLLFIVHDRKHYLRAIWCLDGIQVLSSQSYISPAADETERRVPLSVQTNATKLAQGQQ